ncbi:protein translocase subunit SecF [Candidatus Pacearchaeota archaeon]|nr:protein translocase subunit SecF [Candidatus Pacearchaeota archaeon]
MESHHPKNWYDHWYKILLLPPVVLFILSIVYLGVFYAQHGDFVHKDASLSGGTTITLRGDVDVNSLETSLKSQVPDVSFRAITDLTSGKPIATIIDSSATPEVLIPLIEKSVGYKLTVDNSNIEFTGPTLSQNFYKQLVIAIIFSFILMSIVIFILFRSFVPSIAVIFAALADILMSLAFINLIGVRLSAAGIAAFLMLIGYSVDTDILLTTRVMKKKEGTVNQRIYGAFTTGIFMTVTALIAVLPAFFIVTGLPESFRQIFLILAVGLFADIFNTWLTNASIIKWYADYKRMT